MSITLYTVGHSKRSAAELLALLAASGIQTLIDIRAQPRSRHNPQFNNASLRAACEQAGLVYHWAGRQLGGRRPASSGSPHAALAPALRGFADYMQSEAFVRATAQLVNLAARASAAIMCAEYDPNQCHRSLIADYLTLQGHEVIHLLDEDDRVRHHLNTHARRESAELIYDRHVSDELDLSS